MSTREMNKKILSGDLEKILESLPMLVMLVDLDGDILYWNGGGTEVFGYDSGEVAGKPVWFLYPERSREDFMEELEILRNGNSVSFEVEGRRSDDKMIWLDVKRKMIVDSRGEPVILGTASDITLQKKVEYDLAKSQARHQAILETAVEGIITIDKSGLIQGVNEAAEKMFGYKEKELIGENISMLMPSPYREEHDQYLKNYQETGERKIIGIGREVRGKRNDGTIFPIDLAVSEVKFGNEVIFTGLIKDISKRRKLENEILEIAEEERRRIGQELHDGLGQMLSGIGLISRNLARKLKANELPGAEEVEEISTMIREADEQARNMAHTMTYISLENDGFKEAVRQLCERLQKYTNIKCEFDCTDNIDVGAKNSGLHLFRIVQEALRNAIEHGKATNIQVKLNRFENYLELSVKDDGNGFDIDDIQDKGMGIQTMRYRAHILGGNLKFDIKTGEWTRVLCRVPFTSLTHNES